MNHFLREHGFTPQFPQVGPLQLHYIEIDPYAHDLAQTVVWIGYIQWLRANGYGYPAEPILKPMGANFLCADALFTDWPEVDFIVSNPPFLGDKFMRGELGDEYVEKLRKLFEGRIPGQSDLCCYWFEKARELIEHGKCQRAGLLATQGIRGGANREVLKRIKETGDIFFAVSDRDWLLDGANVHVSMVGFDNATENFKVLDGKSVAEISANLSHSTDITNSSCLQANAQVGFIGVSMHGPFDMNESKGLEMLQEGGNPNLKPNSDAVRPVLNAFEITKRAERRWLVSFPPEITVEDAAGYDAPMKFIRENVQPVRAQNHRRAYRNKWWIPGEARPAMQQALKHLPRFLATPRVSKHRIFVWITPESLPSDATVAFAKADDFFMGIVHSKFHEVWALKQGTRLETRPRYTPTTCFETFPFPRPTPAQETAIAAAAQELNELRERWLNPPEWTVEKFLEFPGSITGPWARYIDKSTIREVGRVTPCAPSGLNPDASVGSQRRAEDCPPYLVGTVRYPRLEPRDADCAAKLKKRTLTNLYNERPAWLDLAHKKLDAAVAAAYGFPADLTDEAILEKLLALNLERAAEEAKAKKCPSVKPSVKSRRMNLCK